VRFGPRRNGARQRVAPAKERGESWVRRAGAFGENRALKKESRRRREEEFKRGRKEKGQGRLPKNELWGKKRDESEKGETSLGAGRTAPAKAFHFTKAPGTATSCPGEDFGLLVKLKKKGRSPRGIDLGSLGEGERNRSVTYESP